MRFDSPLIQSATKPSVQPTRSFSSSTAHLQQHSQSSSSLSKDVKPLPLGNKVFNDAFAEGSKLSSSLGDRRLAAEDQKTYERIYSAITERYKSFNQEKEIGYGEKPGITADIEDISLDEICAVLRHIARNPDKAEFAAKKSAISPLFDKLYLMQNKEQGWALRLHKFAPGGKSQGDEELPHYHRWTLASKILSGGYNNKNYTEIPADQASAEEKYYKYSLKPSADGTERQFTRQEPFEVGMQVSRQTLFKKGDIRHFPIEWPHSVSDLSHHTGTTLTLAHTAKGAKDSSLAYEKDPSLQTKSLDKPATLQEFAASILDKIALLRVISLADKLHHYLQEKAELTPGEQRHIEDYSAPNYLETSLLPALALLDLEETSSEFGRETQVFIREELKSVGQRNLQSLIEENQRNIANGAFSARINSWNELERLFPGPFEERA
ncbi:hypothetical protein [Chelativorans sp. Marseille-P2723]|uniref:hypothetical protein n=1 Tax=Chelativorans sp. Marseille-P2723 TaxID=2709133 RepID=UPI00156F29AC|nr:hypothetical protein [Chelativorans sp. Marseille-P2723]